MRRDELSLPDPPPNDRPSDRWMCGRDAGESPCSRGPGTAGLCPHADPCQPIATWNGRRKRIIFVSLLITVIGLVLVVQTNIAPTVFKPGELSTKHAQILGGSLTTMRCAECHQAAAVSAIGFFDSDREGHAGVSQSDRCLHCHHTTIDRRTALLAHNLPATAREAIRVASAASPKDSSWHDLLPGPDVNQESVQCSSCHREHQGPDGDLLAITNTQCQTCHQDRFGSFASSHPSWNQWPYGRGGEIAFNHSTHANKHFPATIRGSSVAQFQCNDCHTRTAETELVRSSSYEVACGACHDEALQLESADGITLLAIPTLPETAANRLDSWPEQATGFPDGQLTPLASLLLRADKRTADAVRMIPNRDFANLRADNPHEIDAGIIVAAAQRDLLLQIASEGQQAIVDRGGAAGIAPTTMSQLILALPPQLVGNAHRRWFIEGKDSRPSGASNVARRRNVGAQLAKYRGALQSEVPADEEDDLLSDDLAGDGLLGDGLLEADPLSEEPAPPVVSSKPTRFDSTVMLPGGGWYRDDIRMAIRYRGGGHADPLLKSTVELISQLSPDDPVRRRLLATRSVAACVTCHPAAVTSLTAWRSESLVGSRRDFTKFSHAPHLNVAQLSDCTHCHQINSAVGNAVVSSGVPNIDHGWMGPEFAPMTRAQCAECHTPHAAGDACVKCHRYHLDRHQRPSPTRITDGPVAGTEKWPAMNRSTRR